MPLWIGTLLLLLLLFLKVLYYEGYCTTMLMAGKWPTSPSEGAWSMLTHELFPSMYYPRL
jgi:hypothetical protein